MCDREPFFSIEEIENITRGELLYGTPKECCRGVSTDSRNIREGNLFIPIVGETYDGHDFIGQAVQKGAAGVLLQRGKMTTLKHAVVDVPVIMVDDTVTSLGDIASFWRKRFDAPVVAVTGSSGKTTTKEMLASILSLSRNILKSYGSFNNFIGLPLTLLQLHAGHEAVILEMGTNRRGEIKRLTQIADPDIGVITNVGPAHLEGLQSLGTVAREKGDLFSHMKRDGVVIVNRDDDAICALYKQWTGKSITFGMSVNAFVRGENIRVKKEGATNFVLAVGNKRRRITIEAPGMHNVYNALAAAACCQILDIGHDQICRGLEQFRQIPGRMTVHRLKNGGSLVDDTYNANPASTREAIETVHGMKGDNPVIVIMGDMLELGDCSSDMHEEVGRLLAARHVGMIFLKGTLVRSVAEGARKGGIPADRIVFPATPETVIDQLSPLLRRGHMILVKGSRGMKMEEYVQAIVRVFGED
jgi:UDP-N-acetylmuramoyl-tripeptide--D-alanyl-D-alanine ligase